MNKKALSLAETLITLTIIGFIAVLAIPNLYSKYQKHLWATQLHKAYNRIAAGNTMIVRETSDTDNLTRDKKEQWNERRHLVQEAFAKGSGGELCTALHYGKPINCNYTKYQKTEIKYLDNKEHNFELISRYTDKSDFLNYQAVFNYHDGAIIGLMMQHTNAWWYALAPHYYSFTVDVNGGKGPNQVGRDIFLFIRKNGTSTVVPYSFEDTSDCNTNSQGLSCAARIMKDGWVMKY